MNLFAIFTSAKIQELLGDSAKKKGVSLMAKREYWNRKPLFDTGADYLIVYGQNCSGKSYQAKCEAIERAMRGERFFYLRRWQSDINQNIAAMYFADMPVGKLTNGEWDNIVAYQGNYFFERIDEETGKRERSESIGFYGDLNEWQRYKSIAFVNYTLIIFEEFITDGVYLGNDEYSEPTILQRFVTIIARDRKIQVLMIGNTISRTVPYFMEWTPNVVKQRQGTIEVYRMQDEVGEGNVITIAVEYGGKIKGSGAMFFGQASKSIMAGEWSVSNRPKLPKELDEYEEVYELLLEYQTFRFVLKLLVDSEEGTKVLFVYPATGKRKIERVVTDRFTTALYESRYLWDTNPERYIKECIANNRVCYSDNLTGSDFNNVIAQMDI